jgi:hypothetical protein
MTAASFYVAFSGIKPRRVQNAQHCIAASGNKINSLGIYEIEIYKIKRQNIHTPH